MALPTPKYNLKKYADVYAPAEDTHLFLDALEKDAKHLKKMKPLLVCEIGCGSGVLITALRTILNDSSFYFSTDINIQACYATKQTAKLNNVNVEVAAMNFTSAFRCRFDLILFNPPYVVSDINELVGNGLNRAYAGGPQGRMIINRFLKDLKYILTPNGLCYLLLLKVNRIEEIEKLLSEIGYQWVIVLERRIPGEYLAIAMPNLKSISTGKRKMEKDFLTNVLCYYKANNWRAILKLNENSDSAAALKLLWVWPNEENLQFLKTLLYKYRINGIISLGCGCGLLEWILMTYTGLPVVGYEINKEWWQSKYSNPTFIPLRYMENGENSPDDELNSAFALLFCYFNNGKAFQNYIKKYKGEFVIIIGPTEGSGRHTNPLPFSPEFNDNTNEIQWKLMESQEIKNTKDFIVIYKQCASRNNQSFILTGV